MLFEQLSDLRIEFFLFDDLSRSHSSSCLFDISEIDEQIRLIAESEDSTVGRFHASKVSSVHIRSNESAVNTVRELRKKSIKSVSHSTPQSSAIACTAR